MVLLDVSVLVSAHLRTDAPRHTECRTYLESLRTAPEPFGLSDLVLSGVLRLLTHPRAFDPPTPIGEARRFVDMLRDMLNAIVLAPGRTSLGHLLRLLVIHAATGNLIADAWHAALAIEHGCEWVADDADFARFQALRW